MRIGLLTDGYRPGINGIIRFISLHKQTLEAQGHEVFVFTWGRACPGDEPGVMRSPGLPFVRPGYHVGLGYSRRARSVLGTLDLLHANQPLISGWVALRYGRRYDLPVVLTFHSRYDLLAATYLPALPLPVYHAMVRPYLRWCAQRCDLATAPSAEAVEVMRSLGVDCPMEVIPYGVEVARCREPTIRLERRDLQLPAAAPVALSVGRLAAEKNVELLLEALARPELGCAYLLLVGDGPERSRLQERANELGLNGRVRFVGQVDPEDVPAYAALADLFVTASSIEMLPLAVVEAQAAGLPIVGLDVSWIRHAVRHGVNGLLAAPDAESLARTWASLLDDDGLRVHLSEGARATAEQHDVRRTTALMLAHYERLLEEHGRGTHG